MMDDEFERHLAGEPTQDELEETKAMLLGAAALRGEEVLLALPGGYVPGHVLRKDESTVTIRLPLACIEGIHM